MHPPFLGFGPRALEWFHGIEADNSKAYFESNRALWQAEIRDPLERLLEELAEDLGGRAKLTRPNRDIRFSRNKAPYKTNAYGLVEVPGGCSGLYVSISAQGLYSGSGYWRMAADQLSRYRAAVAGDGGAEFDGLVAGMEAAGLEFTGDALRTAPKGFARDHPRLRLLRMKDVLATARLDPAATLDGRAPKDFARSVWDRSRPVMGWMDAHVGRSTQPTEADGRRRR